MSRDAPRGGHAEVRADHAAVLIREQDRGVALGIESRRAFDDDVALLHGLDEVGIGSVDPHTFHKQGGRDAVIGSTHGQRSLGDEPHGVPVGLYLFAGQFLEHQGHARPTGDDDPPVLEGGADLGEGRHRFGQQPLRLGRLEDDEPLLHF